MNHDLSAISCFIDNFQTGDHHSIAHCFSQNAILRGSMANKSVIPESRSSRKSRQAASEYFQEFLGEHGRNVSVDCEKCLLTYHPDLNTYDALVQVSGKCTTPYTLDRVCDDTRLVRLTFQVGQEHNNVCNKEVIQHLHGSLSNLS